MNWRQIPSLSGLRAFEATARLGGFSAAARSLNVTHAAIAQHVRALEAFFAIELVFRSGRSMELTEAGKHLANALQEGFGRIEIGVRDLHDFATTRPLQVTMTPTFAENWMMPRLGGFWADHPEIELVMKPSSSLSDLRRDGMDLAIRYGLGDWPGYESERLTSAQVMVVGSPALIGDKGQMTVEKMHKLPWLLEKQVSEHHVWAETQGIDFSKASVTYFDTNNLVLSAVRAGYGLAIQSVALIERDLQAGTLIELMETQETKMGYFLVTMKGHQSAHLTTFIKWLRCCA